MKKVYQDVYLYLQKYCEGVRFNETLYKKRANSNNIVPLTNFEKNYLNVKPSVLKRKICQTISTVRNYY